ncbi:MULTISPECIES: SusC/RagA family TonB-linked outer membrane protein [Olivibacter]|uniref:SusC/RagA family TonB-linked outer membrane protein n=1 Tax=Olivibacter jilunii TaxID=985016 RepID=A0ABW6B373_9SPHI|nr:SusC/RagA family TonB-linked outer membrane protein [Olivibacter sp. UJ_SKK_5.1]
MKKLRQFLLFLFVLSSSYAYAQEKTIQGRVIDINTGESLSGVTVTIKGTERRTQTNAQGIYELVATRGSILVFSYIGMEPLELTVGAETRVDARLKPIASGLDEVVVTALGIRRDERSLGYTAQKVTAEELNYNKQPNMVNALQGKVAGVTISSTGGAPGQGARIQIRGINSLDPARDNQPLFVIDGVLMDNSTSVQGEGAEGRGLSNRAVDVNPDDIETINILRGGAATALYGLRGANGVVVITTKSGKSGSLKIDYQGTAGFENVARFPELQNTYTQGWQGEYDPASFWPSWGPTVADARAIDPTHPAQLYDHVKDAFRTGSQFKNTLTLSGGSEKITFLSSLSQLNQEGVLPATDFKNYQARLNTTFKLSEKFNGGVNMSVNNSGGYRGNAGRYIEQLIYWSPRHDVNDYLEDNGTMRSYGTTTNPRYVAETNRFKDDVLRFIGNVNFSYKPIEWLNLSYRAGIDTYRDNRLGTALGFRDLVGERLVEENGTDANPGLGFMRVYNQNFRSINSTFIASADHQFSDDFGATLRLGHDLYDRYIRRENTEGSNLSVYDWFSLPNAKTIQADTYEEKYRLMGVFGELSFNYKNYLYLTLTGRNDITSSLVNPRNSFFYPSATLSYVFSDHLKLPDGIDNAKFRFSYARIGKDADPYSTSRGLAIYRGLPTGYSGFTRPNLLGDPLLKPEFTDTWETGLSMAFLQNRLSFDFNYYHSVSKDQIIKIPVSSSIGYVNAAVNAGSMRNQGIELSVNARPVQFDDFSWDTRLNFSMNRNKVLSLREDLTQIEAGNEFGYLSSNVYMWLIPGEAYGDLYGRVLRRYYTPDEIAQGLDQSDEIDPNRPLLIGDNGFPILDAVANKKKLGNVQPDWLGGWSNTFNYKDLSLSFLIDARVGQERYNQLANFYSAFGMAKYTENRNDHMVFEGVLADGTPNTKEVWLGQGVDPATGLNYGDGYYRIIHRGVSENFVEDASWVRLRSVSLGYRFPQKWLQNSFVKSVQLSVTGNNLALWTDYSGFDPESTTTNSGSNVDAFAGMTYPSVRSFLFTLNVGF